jgi:non-heme chloroperoxidase
MKPGLLAFPLLSTSTTLTLRDGTELYYKDWGNKTAPAVVFSHGWPLNSDNWENQMFYLANQGYRVVAHDRRGHGRSSQPWDGNDMDTYADDLYELFEHLDLKDVMMVGHSTGGGDVSRFIGRHGTSRVSKAVLVSAVPPLMVQTPDNLEGLPLSVFDSFRQSMILNRAQFFLDVPTGPFFGFNRPNATISQGLINSWWMQGMMAGFKNTYDCIKAFSETDFTQDLKKMKIPVLIIHGDDDQIVPIKDSALKSIKLVPNGTLKVYKGGAHALPNLAIDQVNKDLLDFLKS